MGRVIGKGLLLQPAQQACLDGKGQCGGTIGALIYLNKANAIRESKYTSLKTH